MFDRGEVSEWVYWTALWRAPWVLCWTTTSAEVKLDSFLQNAPDIFILFVEQNQVKEMDGFKGQFCN